MAAIMSRFVNAKSARAGGYAKICIVM